MRLYCYTLIDVESIDLNSHTINNFVCFFLLGGCDPVVIVDHFQVGGGQQHHHHLHHHSLQQHHPSVTVAAAVSVGTGPIVPSSLPGAIRASAVSTSTSGAINNGTGSLCVGCGSPIQDQYILRVAPDLEWHASCLKCVECGVLLDENCTCFVRDGKTFCRRDYVR